MAVPLLAAGLPFRRDGNTFALTKGETPSPEKAVAINLGDAQAKGGENEKAKNVYQTYLELAPSGNGDAKQQLDARAEHGLGRITVKYDSGRIGYCSIQGHGLEREPKCSDRSPDA